MSATTAVRSKNLSVAAKVNQTASTVLAWSKLLASKALLAAKGGWTYAWTFASTAFRKNAFGITMGASLLLASEKGYKAVIKGITGSTNMIVKAVVGTLHSTSKAIGWLGSKVAGLVGKAHTGAGKWVQGITWTVTGTITAGTDYVQSFADMVTNRFTVSALSSFVTKVVNYSSMTFFGVLAANAVTGGSIAASAATLPVIGGTIVTLIGGGLGTLAVLGAIAVAGIAYSMMFRAEEAQLEADADEIDAIDADSKAKFEEAEQIRAATRANRKFAQAQAHA